MLSKKVYKKNVLLNLYSLMKKKIRTLQIIFYVENWLWKSDFGTFWHLPTITPIKFAKFNDFIWLQLVFSQKYFQLCIPPLKTPQPVLPLSKDKPSLDLKKIIRGALENQSLVITLPWIIEYCSMLDPISVKMRYIQEIYKELIRIYKFVLVPKVIY